MQRQAPPRGMTALGVLFVLALLAVGVLLAIKIVPVYLEYFNVSSSVNSLQGDPDIVRQSKDEIRERLLRRFQVNDVWRVKPEHIRIHRSQDAVTVQVDYEVRVPLVGNVSLLFAFHKSRELR